MISVRPYQLSDRSAVESINYATGLLGASLAELGVSRTLIAHGIAEYFDTFFEDVFVAYTDNDDIVGYILGESGQAHRNEKWAILLRIIKNIFTLPFVSAADRRYIANQVSVVWRAGLGLAEERHFKTPSGAGHLHINLASPYRGQGIGVLLLDAFFKKMKKNKVNLIYANSYLTERNANQQFWMRNGFKEYSRIKSSVWKNIFPGDNIYLVCYTKEIL